MQMNTRRLEQCGKKSTVSMILVILSGVCYFQVTDAILLKQISYFSTAAVYLF